jgi:hypothetical protein
MEMLRTNDAPAGDPAAHVNFNTLAALRKWPSLNNQRRTNRTGPYLLLDGTLDECIRAREIVAELARRREFL